jgi:hypothetical protein
MAQNSYFEERIYKQIKLDPDKNFIEINNPSAEFPVSSKYKIPLVYPDKDDNIVIPVYTLNSEIIPITVVGDGKLGHINAKTKSFDIVRLKNPIVNSQTGDVIKYRLPKGAGTHPWLSPNILQAYRDGKPIKTLILTEGYLKALSGFVNGLYMVGFSSITHYKDSQTKEMYQDVVSVIKNCKVENIIMLYDGDLLDISTKNLQEKRNLSKRPNNFFNSICQIRELLKDYLGNNLSLYFAHVNKGFHKEEPKGLDDVFASDGIQAAEVAEDLLALSKPGKYFYKTCIDTGVLRLKQYFHLTTVDDFYSFHQDKIKNNEFIFNGSHYQVNDKGTLDLKIKAEVKDYFRVVDDYFWIRKVPNRYNELLNQITKVSKKTIEDDHDKRFCKNVAKYNAFVNMPDNVNYQQAPFNCYNIYQELKYKPSETDSDCPTILAFIKHIFQDHYEKGLDYIQLLYLHPKQTLPILCLVSAENETGKSSFIFFLSEIFGDNAIGIGYQDLDGNFNDHYATKLIIACEETFIEKEMVMEKLKSMSTSPTIIVNGKNTKQYTADFYGKFILASNKEEKMLNISAEDKRYWILKVPSIPQAQKNPSLLKDLKEEIPAFLNLLTNRKLSTDGKNSRMWFKLEEIETEARKKMIAASGSALKKILQAKFAEYAEKWELQEFYMSTKSIRECFNIGPRFEDFYIEKVLNEDLNLEFLTDKEGKPVVKRFKYFTEESQFNAMDNVREVKKITHRLQARRVYYIPSKQFTDAEIISTENLLEEALNENGLPLGVKNTDEFTKQNGDLAF